jgi:8-oxo-dGTP pyrophosphatase MutT (NUDIX family)
VERRQLLFAGKRVTLVDRLTAAVARPSQAEMILNDGLPRDWNEAMTEAAVLILVTDRAEPGVILTHRPETMRKHPGQAAFPGGRVDSSDANAIAAALREAEEEIGLPRHMATIIGTVDLYRTITGYNITPVLAVIPADVPLKANPDEVASIFEVPLAYLLNPANHEQQDAIWNGESRHYWEIHWEGNRIWGATAAMIVNLSRRLEWGT